MQREIFGWTFEEKYNEIKPEERYAPLVQQIMQSKEAMEYWKFTTEEAPKDALIQKIVTDLLHLRQDLTGQRPDGRWGRPTVHTREIRERPNDDNLSRFQREKQDIEGVHINNDDIKDVAEDIEHIMQDVDRLMDPEYALTKKSIELDAAIRFSEPMQKLMAQIGSDFGFASEEDAMM